MTWKITLEDSVQSFFARLNWDNRPLQMRSLPMPFLQVREHFGSIPWAGDPLSLAAHSLGSLSAAPEPEPEEEQITLADLFSLF
ncbi:MULTISPECIES: hypothetical protein [unclassified Synechococcus]|jgi:hypothetical protein|uniref:hypothetical protein n=1 Tax=unclassified Synechococcus TaxID=2626047 RepID=UPI0039C3B4A8